jgi:hypothetical protein
VQAKNADDAAIIFRLNWPAIEAMARANLATGGDNFVVEIPAPR